MMIATNSPRSQHRQLLAVCAMGLAHALGYAQNISQRPTQSTPASDRSETREQKVARLSETVKQMRAQMLQYEQQLTALQGELEGLETYGTSRASIPATNTASTSQPEPAAVSASSEASDLQERQAILESQVATHERSKVESESRYPLKLSGLVLFNGFVNTRGVDIASNPSYATPRSGSTGFSVSQSVLGLDASGPRLFGAASHADVRVDFFGSAANSATTYSAGGILRLRTAHAELNWPNTRAFVELDRSLLAPNVPSSLVSVAQPVFAWSGDLWAWNPQIGITQTIPVRSGPRFIVQAALIDPLDPQLPRSAPSGTSVTLAERSRWPGTEARIAFAAGKPGEGPEFGVGGYFSPHQTTDGARFNAWAGTLDARLPLGKYLQLTANAYRGLALGGLGGGGYVDYFYQYTGTAQSLRPLDDVGGWAQLKYKPVQRLEFNTGYGLDNPFAKEIHTRPAPPGFAGYTGLARNGTAMANTIYSPSSYLQFSLEYRRFLSAYANGPSWSSHVIGMAAGYRF